MRVTGAHADAIRHVIGEAWIADSYDEAARHSAATLLPVVTRAGEVFRGPALVAGGSRDEARGILEMKRDIRDLRERIAAERAALAALADETNVLERTIAQATAAVSALNGEQHKHDKAIVACDLQLQRAGEDAARLAQRADQLARERRLAEEERETIDRRQQEARAAIARLEADQRAGDERLTTVQRRLFEAREASEDLSRRAAESRAVHAALVERAAALAAEVQRLEDSAAELETRAIALGDELDSTRRRVGELHAAIAAAEGRLDADVRALETLRAEVQRADEAVDALRIAADQHDAELKTARGALEATRAAVAQLDVARATADADLSHLASSCVESVQASLDEVLSEVEQLERDGAAVPDATAIYAEPVEDDGDTQEGDAAPPSREDECAARTLSAEDAIAALRLKIDRLGPVNMMAIEQFDELETRHAFLTAQRKDLVDSIAQTTEAIKRIDETTRQRFAEAFAAINHNFQETFSTLFGGGRAGLTLIDENDPLESGIEIIAQPPGKRLQSVQLLSGGEKALTAIALMFGLFKYKPSPFCLLDEIDAPLDDANIGRFVEMLRGMQRHTQFILITHNRKTMEIADRLYGVTMEEPGVSKLISVQLN